MTTSKSVNLAKHLDIIDARRIRETTSLTLLIGPDQGERWQAAALVAEEGVDREWDCFAISNSTQTENPEYREYSVTLYCKPHPDYPSIDYAGRKIADAWQTDPVREPAWASMVKSAFTEIENALNLYFAGDKEQVIDVDGRWKKWTRPKSPDFWKRRRKTRPETNNVLFPTKVHTMTRPIPIRMSSAGKCPKQQYPCRLPSPGKRSSRPAIRKPHGSGRTPPRTS